MIFIPLVYCYAYVFSCYGLVAALAFAVFTDLLSALVIKEISFKAGIETLIIALFVIACVRAATYISSFI